jgi:formate dehydrogenase major subunit
MTNGYIDIKNTDMMLIMGGNPAECHPCGFKWAVEAKRTRNAKLIVVDPRFTRTASNADLFLQIRAGTDIAFLGGLINYAIQNNRIAKDYVANSSCRKTACSRASTRRNRLTTNPPGITRKAAI